MTEERLLRDMPSVWLLRGLGTIDLLALIVVFLPWEQILAFHRLTGLEAVPETPLVDYLIRASSALYALHGGLVLVLSTDVPRYRPLIRMLGWLAILHGGLSFYIGNRVGLPVWWRCTEGPAFAAAGLMLLLVTPRQTGSPASD